jgi:dephospho-CoA kinase
MLILKKIAITGGVASGKSLVCQILKNLGIAYIIDSDAIVHHLLSPDTPIGKKVIALLGNSVTTGGQFDRKKIAELVFSDAQKLEELEKILHPKVLEEIQKQYQLVKDKYDLFVVEIPLVYEIKAEGFYDAVIVVLSDVKTCKERLKEKNPNSAIEYEDRMQRQIPPEEKAKKADYIIVNNGSIAELQKEVKTLIPSLLAK